MKKALNIKMRDVVHGATCASCGELFDGEEGCLAPLQVEDGEYPIDGYCCTPCAGELNAGAASEERFITVIDYILNQR